MAQVREAKIKFFGSISAEEEIRAQLPELFPKIWRFSLFLTGAKDTAWDLAQSTCVKAIENSDKYESGTRLESWVYKIANRIWLNELRYRSIRDEAPDIGYLQQNADLSARSGEDALYFRQIIELIYSLPQAQKMAVMLVYVEGFSYSEAAEILSIPIGTVMSRLASARKKLNHHLHVQNLDET